MPQAPQRANLDEALSPADLLARIEDLYRQLQAIDSDTSTARYKRTPVYLQIEATIREYAQLFWALTDAGPTR